jgi:molybdopterin converting factor small subunit
MQYPSLEEVKGAFALAVNQEYLPAGEVALLKTGDEIAIIPPISGG